MKELRPIHTFLVALSTVAILLAISTISIPADAIFGIHSIDMFSALKADEHSSDEQSMIDPSIDECSPSEDYSVDYVRNDIVARKKNDSIKKEQYNAPVDQTIIQSDTKSTDSTTSQNSFVDTQLNSTIAPIKSSEPITQPTAHQTTTIQRVELTGEGGTSIENSSALAPFINKLRAGSNNNRPIRIAVLGDSFIEGDIFTQDLRELFQDRFGGNGVGFVPMASTVAGFRQTINHTFAGWTTHCISTAARRGNYTFSSYTYTPGDGSVSRYATTAKRRHINNFSRARLMFINRGNTTISAKVNNENPQKFTPASSDRLQQITLANDSITSLELSFHSTDSFTAYGLYADGVGGVAVDNYSVRGNSGVSLASTSTELLTQMNSLMPVDLIVLQYGLNVAQADNRNYSQYQKQMQAVIQHIAQAFPNASILLMSVPDRAHVTAAGWQTMPGIKAMEKMQRQLAADCGVAFWSTMKNMQALGGMGHFVDKGWAAKDYTHLSHKGGRVVAHSLFDAIMERYGN